MTAARLYCVRCLLRKPRTDFRETPWHGRAAACMRCEAFRYVDELFERQRWQLEQERAKVRMYRRYVSYLQFRRLLELAQVSTADAARAVEEPYRRVLARHTVRMARAVVYSAENRKAHS